MKKALTIAEAWREIARRIEKGTWNGAGICTEVFELYRDDLITYTQEKKMYAIIDEHLNLAYCDDPTVTHRYWLAGPGVADTRILACYFLALEAEDEGR